MSGYSEITHPSESIMSAINNAAFLRDIRIISGNPTEEEIAGVMAALLLVRSRNETAPIRSAVRSAWSCPARALGIVRPGVHGWKSSSLPR